MAISSVSRVFTPKDPILQTDLELLAKVNTFEQRNFDEGSQQVQDEINNWSMLSNVAKPQDREYINGKLNSLVSGINNLGGVNLGDPNNVNQLKSMGYNITGDSRVTNAVATSRRLQGLQQDIATKTSGKNAGNYDPTMGNYLIDQYSDWLNDGQVGTSFEGPTSLQQGTYGQYVKKIQDTLKTLQPDSNDVPRGDLDKSLGYYQINNKYIKKERVQEAIKAVTDANDYNLINAHSWSQMRGFDDQTLANMQVDSYNSKLKQTQTMYNDVLSNKALAKTPQEQQAFQAQLDQLKTGIDNITSTRDGFMKNANGNNLDKGTKQSIMSGLFYDAFLDQYGNAASYSQTKEELKLNAPLAFQTKENRMNFQFAEANKYNWAKLGLEQSKLDLEALKTAYATGNTQGLQNMGIKGPASSAPLSMIPVNPNSPEGSNKFTAEGVDQDAATNYQNKLNNFYTNGYNYLAGNITDPSIRNLLKKNVDGSYAPVDGASAKKLQLLLDTKYQELNKLADTPVSKRKDKIFNQDDATFFNSMQDLKQAEVYKEQTKDLSDAAFKAAYGDNDAFLPKNKLLTFNVSPHHVVSYTYDKFKELIDSEKAGVKNTELETLRKNAPKSVGKEYTDNTNIGHQLLQGFGIEARGTTVDAAISKVNDYYDKAKSGWEKVSQTYNPYGAYVSLPKSKEGKVNSDWAKFFADKVQQSSVNSDGKLISDVQISDIDLKKVWVTFDGSKTGNESKARYKAEVIYKKAGDGAKTNQTDLTAIVDLTDEVVNQNNPFLKNLYPDDDASAVYGMVMDNKGYTPSGVHSLQTTSYPQGTHKYQIIKIADTNNNIVGYKVMVNVPGGSTVALKNKSNPQMGEYFPPNINSVKAYVNYQFSNDQLIKDFYIENKLNP